MSSRGYNETLTTPNNHKDSSGMSLKAFDTHFKTLNNGLLSVAKNLGGMHTKVGELEVATKSANDLKHRVDTMEKTLTAHGKVLADIRGMLSDMSKAQQAPPNTSPQFPPQFTSGTVPMALPQKSRAQLIQEAQRLQAANKNNQPVAIQPIVIQPPKPVEKSPQESSTPAEKSSELSTPNVSSIVDAEFATQSQSQPQTLDQILESVILPSTMPKSETASETVPIDTKKEESSGEDTDDPSGSNSDIEISDDEETGKTKQTGPLSTPRINQLVKSPVKSTPAVKPAAKSIPRRITTQKKK